MLAPSNPSAPPPPPPLLQPLPPPPPPLLQPLLPPPPPLTFSSQISSLPLELPITTETGVDSRTQIEEEDDDERRSREMTTQREAEIDIDVEGEDSEREEEIESEGRPRWRRRRPGLGLGLEPRLMSCATARAKVEVGETRAWNNTPEFHALYFTFVALLHVHIQHLYQHGDDSPFQTHPLSMRISVVAIFSYGLAALFGHAPFCSNYSQIVDYVIMVSGVLYPVSLISVFIPNGLSCLLYIIWLIFSVMVVPWNFLLVCSSQWILQRSGIAHFIMTCIVEVLLVYVKL